MKKLINFVVISALSLSPLAMARDSQLMFSIKDAMNTPAAQDQLKQGIKFYFGDTRYPEAKREMLTTQVSRKTNGFNKSEVEACNWVFLSAMLVLQQKAINEGGNAVVNIVSNYKHIEYSSRKEFECHDGAFVTGVALKGKVVKL